MIVFSRSGNDSTSKLTMIAKSRLRNRLKIDPKSRSSHQMCSIKKAVLKNSAIFIGKRLCWSHFLINLSLDLRSANGRLPDAKILKNKMFF